MARERDHPEDDHVSHDGRVMEVLSEHNRQGWLEGYALTGRHGILVSYEAFAIIADSMVTQHSKWLKTCVTELPWRKPVPSLNYLVSSTCWRNDHNGFSHQGPGFIDTLVSKQGIVTRIYLPPDSNCLSSCADHWQRSRNYINLIVIDKQPHLLLRDGRGTRALFTRWVDLALASSDNGEKPDIVLACAGDVATQESLAAAWLLRKYLPEMKVRFVNVVDPMRLWPAPNHPHGMDKESFVELFTRDAHAIFAFHGYPTCCISCFTAARIPIGSTFAALSRKDRRPRRLTWSC